LSAIEKFYYANTVGNPQTPDSLLGKLSALGVDTRLVFVYAVYDDNGVQNIYYRDEIEPACELDPQLPFHWVSFEQIIQADIQDRAVKVMLHRYISERLSESFGVYFGDSESGEVHVPT